MIPAKDLFRYIEQTNLENFYYFFGEEEYLMQEAIELLKVKCLGEGPADFNYDLFYYGDSSLQNIMDVADTLPMFSSKRLIVVKNIGELKKKDQDLLAQYLEKNITTTCLIFVGKKPDLRKKIFQNLKKTKSLVEFSSPKYAETMDWINKLAAKHDKKIDKEAKDYLYQMVGNSLLNLSFEIKKAVDYMKREENIITKDILSKVVSKHRLESVFDLTQAIGDMDRSKALYYLAHLLDQGENEIGILTLISRHMRILYLVKEGAKEGLTKSQLASRAGVPPFYLNQYSGQASHWDFSRLDQVHKALVLTDKALKSSPVSSPIWLENFVLKSCDPNF